MFLKFHSKTSLQDSVAPCSSPRLQSTFYTMPQYPCCFSKNGRMNFDRCLTQDDQSYITEICTLKTLFTQMRVQRSTKKYFNRLHTCTDDSIFKLQPCLTPGGACWSAWYRCLNNNKKKKKKKMMRKGIFFFKLGNEQRCHRLRSEKKAFSWKMIGFRHKPVINPVIMSKIQTCGHC